MVPIFFLCIETFMVGAPIFYRIIVFGAYLLWKRWVLALQVYDKWRLSSPGSLHADGLKHLFAAQEKVSLRVIAPILACNVYPRKVHDII